MKLRGSLVLVVDDEDLVLSVIHNVLDTLGLSVVEVKDGESAVDKLRRRPFDLVIADKNLPGINGLEVLRRAKAYDPTMSTLLVTGYSSRESVVEAMVIGVDDYIVKPFEVENLANKVKEALERRQFRRQVTPRVAVHRRRRRILVCDPDERSRQILLDGMQAMGHTAETVDTLNEILDAISNGPYDGILCDLEVLNRDPDTTQILRSMLLIMSDIQFICIARETNFESAIQSLHSGASRVLVRPLESAEAVANSLKESLGVAPGRRQKS
jgi:DNA-binding NtrC family response regulator